MVREDPSRSSYLLIGRDAFLKQDFLKDLRSSVIGKGDSSNYAEFHADEDALFKMLDFLSTSPFLSEKRMAVLWQVEDLEEEENQRLLDVVPTLKASSVAVFVSGETGVKKNKFLKELSERTRLVACHPPFESDWPRWVETRVKKKGKNIAPDAAQLMLERVGRDTSALDGAAEQLAVYTHERMNITRADVENLLGKSLQSDVFQLSEWVLERRTVAALAALDQLAREGVRAPEIVGAMASQFERLLKAVVLRARGMNAAALGQELKIHSFFQEKFYRQAGSASEARVRAVLGFLLECDETVKTGRLPEKLALQRLVLEACSDPVISKVGT